MKRKKLFWQIYPSYLAISLVSIIVLLLISRFTFRSFYFQEKAQNLLEKAYLIEGNISSLILEKDFILIQEKINYMDKKSNNRLTIILPGGKVIADSRKKKELMTNHKDRPEILTAISGSVGMSKRFSETMKEDHLYQAIPLYGPDKKLIGVLRSSASIENLKITLFNISKQVFWEALVIVIVLSLVIGWYSKSITTPIEEIKTYTEKFSQGDYDQKIKISNNVSQEIYSLAQGLNKMTAQVNSHMEKIIKQKNEIEAVFTSMVEGVITVDPKRRIFHMNLAARSFFNLDEKKVYKGIPLEEVIRNHHLIGYIDHIFTDKSILEQELNLNNQQILQVHGTALKSLQNQVMGALLVFNDITKVRRLELHRKEFVANVSHELRTPLTSIQGYLEVLLENDLKKEDRTKFLGIVQKNASRFQVIIEDLLSLSQIEKEQDNNEIKKEIIPLSPVLGTVKLLCLDKAQKKGINLIVKVNEELNGKINSHLLEQALVNLVENAIKYGDKDSQIIISAKKTKDHLEFAIKDEGPGISPEHQKRVFERFYCIDKARSRELGGSGLGLSIVKHIALAHGGSVALDSTYGKGSTFYLNLPIS
ncbi:MAG: hypothetical protein DRQ88_12295 [Epsilonproteobacteria bacterium]|nr:MAG: hypothetical protein DRQ88_12295 [Campylobacterota bacterium]RLA64785.1 MAG: hypothetical protein DRQ89_02915 [Campylobacterota bacterium]